MTIAHIIILLATGTVSGFLGGLLGVGGGVIMTPVQDVVYTAMGVAEDITIKLAFGTSLLVILPTAINGAWRHNRKGAVWWKAAIIMGICTAIVAFGTAALATHLSGAGLKIAFGIIILTTGIRMLTATLPEVEQEPRDNPWLWVVWAIPVGFVTGITGLGGGILLVPILVLALKFKIHSAVATSLAIMIFSSIGGVTGYIVSGLGIPDLPAYSIGYVHLPTWLMLSATSIGMVQVGAITAHRLPAKKIEYIFVALMFLMGLRMLGAGLKMPGILDWPI